jgi:hypothetical protein
MDLILRVTGEVAESNLDDWKKEVLEKIKSADRELVTDADFTLAGETVAAIKEYEKAIITAREEAQRGTADIAAMYDAVAEILDQLGETRLSLEKKVKARRAEKIEKLVNDAYDKVKAGIEAGLFVAFPVEATFFGSKDVEIDREELAGATKNKKTFEGMVKALDATAGAMISRVLEFLVAANQRMERLVAVEQDYPGAFHDKKGLAKTKTDGELEAIIDARISHYKLQVKEKEEREVIPAQAGQSGQNGTMSRPSTSPLFNLPPRSSAPPPEPPPPQAQAQAQEQTRQPPPSDPVAKPAPEGETPVADFIFTVLLKCDVEKAKDLAKELAAYFGPRKEIIKFYLKRA